MARLEIATLGPPDIRLEGQPATGFASDKVRALLFYLAVESGRSPAGRVHRRESLAGLLWPGYPERSARTNQSASRLTWAASGDLAAQVRCMPVVDPLTGDGPPAIGGLLLWQDAQNYLRLDSGLFGPRAITLLGCIEGQDVVVGRGSLSTEPDGPVHLRLERRGGRVRGLCSPDGQQ